MFFFVFVNTQVLADRADASEISRKEKHHWLTQVPLLVLGQSLSQTYSPFSIPPVFFFSCRGWFSPLSFCSSKQSKALKHHGFSSALTSPNVAKNETN